VYATGNGELGLIVPVEEKTFKRLHDIYTEMIHRLEHPAGLNPRAYRLYRIPARFGSQPMKNVLDGGYLLRYNNVSTVERMKWARNKGTSDERVLDDLVELIRSTAFF
jgi:cleavage and polyadenylation specificity factor subunit 1